MKKAISLIASFLCALSCLTMAGCGKKKTTEVYFLNFKPESATVYEELAKKYEEEKGVKVKVVTAAANGYEQTLKSEIAKSNAPTIFQINGPIGYDSWKDYCLDLKDKKSTLTSAEQINNFAKLKEVTEDMSKHLKELGLEGVFASTSLANGEDWRWQTHLLNVPLYYEFAEKENGKDATLTGLAAKEIKFKYKDNFEKLFDLYINNSITKPTLLGSKSVADSMAEFALGKVAMIQNGNWAWSQISGVSGNTVKRDDIKMLPLYTGIDGEEKQGICIGTENYLAINKKVSKELQDQSLDFLYWMFSSNTGKRYVTEKLNFITPFTTFSQDEQPDDPLAKEIVRYMNDDSLNTVPWIFTSFPSEAYKKEVGSALLDYVQGDKKWADVEKSITEKWKSERA